MRSRGCDMNRASGGSMWRTFWPVGALAAVGLGLCACDYSRYERGFPIADRALREVGTLDLAEASTTRPTSRPVITTVPSTKRAEELLPTPPVEVRLTIQECRQLALPHNLDLKAD